MLYPSIQKGLNLELDLDLPFFLESLDPLFLLWTKPKFWWSHLTLLRPSLARGVIMMMDTYDPGAIYGKISVFIT